MGKKSRAKRERDPQAWTAEMERRRTTVGDLLTRRLVFDKAGEATEVFELPPDRQPARSFGGGMRGVMIAAALLAASAGQDEP